MAKRHRFAIDSGIGILIACAFFTLPLPGCTSRKTPSAADWRRAYEAAPDSGGALTSATTVGAGHVTCSTIGPRGELILGTEGEGLFIYDAARVPHWRHLAKGDGLPDLAVYALARDARGRIWIGHGSDGVSVWNGHDLRHYPVSQGPLGGRVFSIAVGPDKSVWLATSAGLTRYDDVRNRWSHYTTANGLPALQASKLAFAPDGKLYVATQAAGLAIGSPSDNYAVFHTIEAKSPDDVSEIAGTGLPSNLCNDVVITPQGHIYVATCYGLARSIDGGKTFYFFRGDGTTAQTSQRNGETPRLEKSTNPGVGHGTLHEDYIAALATDARGRVYVAYRHQGGEIFDPATADPNAPLQRVGSLDADEPTSMLVTPGGQVLITEARTGARLLSPESVEPFGFTPRKSLGIPLPPPAGAPTLKELNTLLEAARGVEPDTQAGPLVLSLPDDWTTQGAYLGRHGKFFAALAAMVAPSDLVWGTGMDRVKYAVTAREGALRYYVAANHTSDAAALELFGPYLDSRVKRELTTWDVDRRQSEWNDFGGGLTRAEDGPNLYVGIHVPPGLFIMSLYFHNRDGSLGPRAPRDFDLSVRLADDSLRNNDGFAGRHELARSRAHQFGHGVYKQFLVRGPIDLQTQVGRNHSHIAIAAALMLDEVDEKSTAYFATNEERNAARNHAAALFKDFAAKPHAAPPLPSSAPEAADALLAELDTARAINPRWWAQNHRVFYDALLRFYNHQPATTNLRQKATCCYYLQLFEAWEANLAATHQPVPHAIEKALRWPGNKDVYPTQNYELVRQFLEVPTPRVETSHRGAGIGKGGV